MPRGCISGSLQLCGGQTGRSAGKARRPVQTGAGGRACARAEAPQWGSGRRCGEGRLAEALQEGGTNKVSQLLWTWDMRERHRGLLVQASNRFLQKAAEKVEPEF